MNETNPLVVKALHNFKGSNNDELCFKKGDIITITQAIDGGWWEGTLNGVTGWFPSNYVKEMKQDSVKLRKSISYQQEAPLSPKVDNMKMYRGIVFKDIVDTENNHLSELQTLISQYLTPLRDANILSEEDYVTLKGNIDDVFACNSSFLKALEDVQEKPLKEQKIGGVFINMASQIKKANLAYCANHPKAAATIERNSDSLQKFMEEHGAASPGTLVLTTGLSSPFRRLEKYPALLQELQRHTEENHIDRGDAQRAIYVYKDIAAACINIRRQKENELEVMSGNIRGWEGEDIHTLGEIIYMGLVIFLTEDQEKKDRYLVLFPHNVVILSVSPRMSAFTYEGKLPISGITVRKLDMLDVHPYAFEITGNMIQRIIVICSSQEVLDQWLSVLPCVIVNTTSAPVVSKSSSHSLTTPSSPVSEVAQQPIAPPHHSVNSTFTNDEKPLQQSTRITVAHKVNNKVWSSWCLKPHPPIRPSLSANKGEVMLRRSNSRHKEKGKPSVPDEKNYEGDMKILQVIEAYCSTAKSRYTVNSTLFEAPPLLIAEEEKIFIEDIQGSSGIEERSLVDTVYALRDQIQELKSDTSQLFKDLEEEKNARKKLEIIFKKHVFGSCDSAITSYFDD